MRDKKQDVEGELQELQWKKESRGLGWLQEGGREGGRIVKQGKTQRKNEGEDQHMWGKEHLKR